MKGNKTKKIIALMLLISIITATSNMFINKVSAITSMRENVVLSDGGTCYVSISIVDSEGDYIDLNQNYSFGFEDFKNLRFRVSVDVGKNCKLVAVDYEGNEADILNNINLSPRFNYIMGLESFRFEPVRVWIEDTYEWVFEYKMNEMDIKNYGATITKLKLYFGCIDGDYDIMYYAYDKSPLASFGDEWIEYEIGKIKLDVEPPYLSVGVLSFGEGERSYCKKGTKINIIVYSTEALTDLTGNLGIDPKISLKFGDGRLEGVELSNYRSYGCVRR